jgi:hypothetical protein
MHRYVVLVASVLLLSVGLALAQNADTVDGFDAYGTPHANALLALDSSKHFPISVIPDNSIPGGKLAYGAVTAGRLANNSVTSGKITNGTIQGEDVGIPLIMGGSRDGYLIGCFNGSTGSSATGVCGYSTAASGYTRGVVGACQSVSGKGVYGVAKATSGANYGVYGETYSGSSYAVYGKNNYGSNWGGIATFLYGVYGRGEGLQDVGVGGVANNGTSAIGIYGTSSSGYAGYFDGRTHVKGTFTSTDKQFKIDHPLDPENMYLHHACVESAERMNIYNGAVVLDRNGEAWVSLPDWFEALNRDFLYQLTPVGGPAPDLHIAQKIQDGCFAIAGGRPGMEVCWQVTGTRADPYALVHPFEVEVEKSEVERGYYMHPELYGMPETMGVEWATHPGGLMPEAGG